MAAIRLCKYWKRRTELFGDAAFRPLTLANCREIDEDNEFSMGFLNLLPLQDDTGRSMIFIDPSVVEGKQYNDESMVSISKFQPLALVAHQFPTYSLQSPHKGTSCLVYSACSTRK